VTARQKAFNIAHAWYRTTVEHSIGNFRFPIIIGIRRSIRVVLIGYLKRFRIIASTYRGRLDTHSQYLERCMKIITCISVLHCRRKPLRKHAPLFGAGAAQVQVHISDFRLCIAYRNPIQVHVPVPVPVNDAALAGADEEPAGEGKEEKKYGEEKREGGWDGNIERKGDPAVGWLADWDDRLDIRINSGLTIDDLHHGQAIEAWYRGAWWPGSIYSKRLHTVSVRFDGSRARVPGYQPRLIRKYRP
jgi:hypothetical protein